MTRRRSPDVERVRVPGDQTPVFYVPGAHGGWFVSLLYGFGTSVDVPVQDLRKLLAGSRGEVIIARRLTHVEQEVLERERATRMPRCADTSSARRSCGFSVPGLGAKASESLRRGEAPTRVASGCRSTCGESRVDAPTRQRPPFFGHTTPTWGLPTSPTSGVANVSARAPGGMENGARSA